ncbi:hypothetical protein E6B06_004796 [Escherichia coli]|nr:hypothetical protein [Escherichia coli]
MHSDQVIVALAHDYQKLQLCFNAKFNNGVAKTEPEYLLIASDGRIVARKHDKSGASWLTVHGNYYAPTAVAILDLDLTSNQACVFLRPFN